jgi:3-isopropylmalate dehydrogenase
VRIVCLPGDGIGVEVTAAAREVLAVLAPDLDLEEHLFGGAAILAAGTPFPDDTLAACRKADAVLVGAVGLPRFDAADVRPEQGLIALRKALDVYANLRPSRRGPIDLLVVRELVGGLYYGPKGTRDDGTVFDTLEYHPRQVERIAHRAFVIARSRRHRVTSVDEASALTGGLGLAASASLGDGGPGIFEPVHGSAPDIAGRGIANPAAMLRSAALMLEHGLDRPDEGRRLEAAVDRALERAPTPDLGGTATTADAVAAVLDELER